MLYKNIFVLKNGLIISALGIIGGLCNFAILIFINLIIKKIFSNSFDYVDMILVYVYILLILMYVSVRRNLAYRIINYTQNVFWKLRLQILKMILKTNYEKFILLKNEIHSTVVYDIGILTQASLSLLEFIIASIVVFSCLIYLFTLSATLFCITLIFIIIGIFVFQFGILKNKKLLEKTRELDSHFVKYFNSILFGFKELYITPMKGHDIYEKKIVPIYKESFKNNTSAFVNFLNNQIAGQILFYILIGTILLFYTSFTDVDKIIIVNYVFILLYILGSVEAIMVLIPNITQAKVSFDRIQSLRNTLLTDYYEIKDVMNNNTLVFENISVNSLIYRYKNKNVHNQFEIGPIDFYLTKGETIFIYGGNGSGKTTFIYNLIGILKYHSGEIKMNQNLVDSNNFTEYKNNFSIVFSDFYLFDEFYGNFHFDQNKALIYLKLFEIDHKVKIVNAGFSTIELSAGQRKRLALINALLENKPVLILDEWAADQDPYFRRKFYTEIIPFIKSEGISIIAITHDDKYYCECDKLYKMEDGKIFLIDK